MFSAFAPKGFVAGAPNENAGEDGGACAVLPPNSELPEVLDAPNENPSDGRGAAGCGLPGPAPFSCVSRVGLSSMRNSCSLLFGGVTGRVDGELVTPNVNGLLETSLPLLAAVGALKENPVLEAGVGAKLNIGFFSPTAGGVLGGAPKENGLFELSTSVALDGWPNEKPPPTLNGDFWDPVVADGAGGTVGPNWNADLGGSDVLADVSGPLNDSAALEALASRGGFEVSGTSLACSIAFGGSRSPVPNPKSGRPVDGLGGAPNENAWGTDSVGLLPTPKSGVDAVPLSVTAARGPPNRDVGAGERLRVPAPNTDTGGAPPNTDTGTLLVLEPALEPLSGPPKSASPSD